MTHEETTVTLHGNAIALEGPLPAVGDAAPDFVALDGELSEKTLADVRGHVVVLLAVPSLDTPVCDTEAKRFNQEAAGLGDDVRILVISMDLPFAQQRWCQAGAVERVTTLSDHRDASFGRAFGVLIPALRLLARAVFVLDRDGVVRYVQLVPEVTDEPDYAPVLEAVATLVKK